jgi:hypothetical protein
MTDISEEPTASIIGATTPTYLQLWWAVILWEYLANSFNLVWKLQLFTNDNQLSNNSYINNTCY